MRIYLVLILSLLSCKSRSPNSHVSGDDDANGKRKVPKIVIDIGGPIVLNESKIKMLVDIVESYESLFKRTPREQLKPEIPVDPVLTDSTAWHEYRKMRLAEAEASFAKLKAALAEEDSKDKLENANDVYDKLQAIRQKYYGQIAALQNQEKETVAKINCLRSDQEKWVTLNDQNSFDRCEKDIGFAELDLAQIRDSYRTAKNIYLDDRAKYVDYLRKSINFEWDKMSCVIRPSLIETTSKKKINIYYGDVSPEWKTEEYAIPTSDQFKYLNGYHLPFNLFAIGNVQRDISRYKGDSTTEWVKTNLVLASEWIDLSDEFDMFRVFASGNKSVNTVSGQTYASTDPSFDRLYPKICNALENRQNKNFANASMIGEMQTQAKVLAAECACWSNVRKWTVVGRASFNY